LTLQRQVGRISKKQVFCKTGFIGITSPEGAMACSPATSGPGLTMHSNLQALKGRQTFMPKKRSVAPARLGKQKVSQTWG